MREIKFRAWEESLEYMHEGSTNHYMCLDDSGKLEYDNLVFMQYIGVKDKNGVEIYEGDIVVIRFTKTKEVYMKGDIRYGKIDIGINGYEYTNNILGFYPHCKSDDLEYLYGKFVSSEVEVIGNIYEDKGLLDEK